MDQIRIDNLSVFAYHGVFDFEQKNGQTFFINLILDTDLKKAGLTDELSLSTNYGEVCHMVNNWMKEHTCKLIETVAENLAKEILLQFPLIKKVTVEIRKPEAPIGLPFESVSVKIERGWHKAYIAFGSNMGDKGENIALGLNGLKANDQVRMGKISDIFVTKPYGGVEQDDFLNGVCEIETILSKHELLDFLHEIEAKANRVREIHWGPRTLDLDILFYDKEVFEDEVLIIPHVDLQNRDFVLKPLSQIAPYLRHPVLGKTIRELWVDLQSKN